MAEEVKKNNIRNGKRHEEQRVRRNKKERKPLDKSDKVAKRKDTVKRSFKPAKKDNTFLKENENKKKVNIKLQNEKQLQTSKIVNKKVRRLDNKTSTIIIACVMTVLIILLAFLLVKSFSKTSDSNGIIIIKSSENEKEPVANTGDIIRTQEAFDKLFDYDEKDGPNFDEHSYAVIVLCFDTCQKKNLEVKNYTLDNELLTLYMSYNGKCNACELNYSYYLVPVPMTTDKLEIAVDYERTNELPCVLKVN